MVRAVCWAHRCVKKITASTLTEAASLVSARSALVNHCDDRIKHRDDEEEARTLNTVQRTRAENYEIFCQAFAIAMIAASRKNAIPRARYSPK